MVDFGISITSMFAIRQGAARVRRPSLMKIPGTGMNVEIYLLSVPTSGLVFFFFFILRRMGKNKTLAHHTPTYFHTRRVSI